MQKMETAEMNELRAQVTDLLLTDLPEGITVNPGKGNSYILQTEAGAVRVAVTVPTGPRGGDGWDVKGEIQEVAEDIQRKAETKAEAERKKAEKIARDEAKRAQKAKVEG